MVYRCVLMQSVEHTEHGAQDQFVKASQERYENQALNTQQAAESEKMSDRMSFLKKAVTALKVSLTIGQDNRRSVCVPHVKWG